MSAPGQQGVCILDVCENGPRWWGKKETKKGAEAGVEAGLSSKRKDSEQVTRVTQPTGKYLPAICVPVGSLDFSCSSSASKVLTQAPTGADIADEGSHSSGLNVLLILPTMRIMRIRRTRC